ncbi:MAG: nucleotidyltransferase domain-containing protein [Candidatus Thermoplasmatota archaeon]
MPPNRPQTPGEPPQLAAIVRALQDRYSPQQMILFGSFAWGSPREGSDLDLLVVKKTEKGFFERCAEVRELIREERRGIPLDLIVYTPQEIEERLASGDPVVTDAFRRGIVLQAA